MTDIWGGPSRPAIRSSGAFRPSSVFLAIVAVFAGSGWALWSGAMPGRPGVFVYVLSGWLLSLCLHEYAHALIAYHGGDRSVAAQGYLTLNPFKYTHAVFSIVLPLLFVLLGGIGLPGGAVYINKARLRGRVTQSLVSAAGPLTNVAFAALTLVPVSVFGADGTHVPFWLAMAFLGFLQATASVLNLLPVPGLGGFGIVEPWLPRHWLEAAAKVGPLGVLAVFAVLWVPVVNSAFFSAMDGIVAWLGVEPALAKYGHFLFTFWNSAAGLDN